MAILKKGGRESVRKNWKKLREESWCLENIPHNIETQKWWRGMEKMAEILWYSNIPMNK